MSAQVISLEERRRARELERAAAELERASSYQAAGPITPAVLGIAGAALAFLYLVRRLGFRL